MRLRPLAPALLALACGSPEAPGTWDLPLKGLDHALLSVWGTGSRDVWAVGGDVGDGPAVLHYDGASWTRLSTGSSGTLWWVTGRGDGVWMAGEGGLVLRYDVPSGQFEAHPTPGSERLYGVFPFSDSDVWAVGGDDTTKTAVIYHFDGSDWSVPAGVTPELTAGMTAFYKVWGAAADDLWIVGEGSAAIHHHGGAWDRVETPADVKLFTVHGDGELVLAVGGAFQGLILELATDASTDVTPPISEAEVMQLNGVFVGANATIAVGAQGSVWRRDDAGKWTQDPDAPETARDYHSAYVDPDGGLWAVGGQLYSDPPTDGVLAHFGQPLASNTIEE